MYGDGDTSSSYLSRSPSLPLEPKPAGPVPRGKTSMERDRPPPPTASVEEVTALPQSSSSGREESKATTLTSSSREDGPLLQLPRGSDCGTESSAPRYSGSIHDRYDDDDSEDRNRYFSGGERSPVTALPDSQRERSERFLEDRLHSRIQLEEEVIEGEGRGGGPPSQPRVLSQHHLPPSPHRSSPLDPALHEQWTQQEREAMSEDHTLWDALVHTEAALQTLQKKYDKEVEAHEREAKEWKERLAEERAARESAEKELVSLLELPSSIKGDGEEERGHRDPNSSAASVAQSALVSDTFYQKLREREERARNKVRREFVRRTQEELHTEKEARLAAEKQLRDGMQSIEEAQRRCERAEREAKEAIQQGEEAFARLQQETAKGRTLQKSVDELQAALASGKEKWSRQVKELEEIKYNAQLQRQSLEKTIAQQRALLDRLLHCLGLDDRPLSGVDALSPEALQLQMVKQVEKTHEGLRNANQWAEKERAIRVELAEAALLLEDLQHRYQALQQREKKAQERYWEVQQTLEAERSTAALKKAEAEDHLAAQQITLRRYALMLQQCREEMSVHLRECGGERLRDAWERKLLQQEYGGELLGLREEVERYKTSSSLQPTGLQPSGMTMTTTVLETSSIPAESRPSSHPPSQSKATAPSPLPEGILGYSPLPSSPTPGLHPHPHHSHYQNNKDHHDTNKESRNRRTASHSRDSAAVCVGNDVTPLAVRSPRRYPDRAPSPHAPTTQSIQPPRTAASPLRYRPGFPSDTSLPTSHRGSVLGDTSSFLMEAPHLSRDAYRRPTDSEVETLRGEVAERLQEVSQKKNNNNTRKEVGESSLSLPRRRQSSPSPGPFGRP